MPGQRPILAMSFIASLGITFVVLACKLPKDNSNFWPLLVLLFYLFLPFPLTLARRISKDTALGMSPISPNWTRDLALFFTSGVMISIMALPIVLARSPESKPLVAPISCFLVEFGNVLCLVTLALFYIYFSSKDGF